MNDLISQIKEKSIYLGQEMQKILDDRECKRFSVFGLHSGQKVLLAYNMSLQNRVVYVCDDYYHANKIFELFAGLTDSVVNMPEFDDVLADRTYNNLNSQARLDALLGCVEGIDIVVVTVAALLQPCADFDIFKSEISSVKKSSLLDPDVLNARLINLNYSRVGSVEQPGQISWRGDIIDVWGAGQKLPIRLEFFGDCIENIKYFDPQSRLALHETDSFNIAPNRESGQGLVSKFFGKCTVIFDDARLVADAKNRVLFEHSNRIASLMVTKQIKNNVVLDQDGLDFGVKKIAFHRDLSQNRIFVPQHIFDIKASAILDYSRDFSKLKDDIEKWICRDCVVSLCVGNSEQKNILQNFLTQHSLTAVQVQVVQCGVLSGADLGSHIIIGQKELFRANAKKINKVKAALFTQIEPGDFVVHITHGIGKYEGSKTLDISGYSRDYFVIKYKNDDTLYVPVENMDSISKYSSNNTPTLNKLGGQEFAKIKARVKQGIHKMALDLLALYAKREQTNGTVYNTDSQLYAQFEDAFEYVPTECQIQATKESLDDLKKGKVMDRLICGDVGYGKTEVAMRVAFFVTAESKQAAFVCPTTILARQHYHSLKKRMEPFGLKIACFTRFESVKQIERNIEALKNGSVDIAIGTHRLLQKDISFKNLGLLILDEEQRFGVSDKEKIKRLKSDINVLTLSATPIPRTLHMSLQQIRDISVLDTPPKTRLPVQTYVARYTDDLLKDAILRELGRQGGVFVVYNNIAKLSQFATHLQNLLPHAKIAIAHGQQPQEVMEDAVSSFIQQNVDILLASTIVENGIDISHANTMIVLDSDRLGLAQMYQLRGRVGRAERQAYVFFTYDFDKLITETAQKRLDAIQEFTEFGSGFKLAMRDLEIRGAGNVLGREQHGHMDKVGYDMYCKLLADSVKELRSGSVSVHTEVKVITDLPSFIPEDYVYDKQSKLDIYGRLTQLYNLQDREKLYSELKDIYGTPPVSVANLLTIGVFKNLAALHGAIKITLKKQEYSISFGKLKDVSEKLQAQLSNYQVLKTSTLPTIVFSDAKMMLKALV
ncbi:MAG: transcription-repair coupling factor [Clostridiales bacterium]|jgi:transcription-repair coupling factor (superfamily II helicase)|nr:transcription-repair coupling factor [Clostridiales bacterium]